MLEGNKQDTSTKNETDVKKKCSRGVNCSYQVPQLLLDRFSAGKTTDWWSCDTHQKHVHALLTVTTYHPTSLLQYIASVTVCLY